MNSGIDHDRLPQLRFTEQYKNAIEMTDAFEKHIWENGTHNMRSEFNRASGTGHIYCLTCHKVIWEE